MNASIAAVCLLPVVLAAPAKADNAAAAYAEVYGLAVCSTLDDYPSFDGIIGIGRAIAEDGLTMEQAGEVIALSVANLCPRYKGLLIRFSRAYGDQSMV